MIEQLKEKLKNLEIKEIKVKPKIQELEKKRDEEINAITEKYEKLIVEVNLEVVNYDKEVFNALINSLVDSVMSEFDAKRSTSEYAVTNEIKEYRQFIAKVEMFPKELVEKLDKIVDGTEQIESLAYDIDGIKEKYLKS